MKKRWIAALAIIFLALFALRPRQRPIAEIPAVTATPAAVPASPPSATSPPAPPAPPAAAVTPPATPDAPPLPPTESDAPAPAPPEPLIPETPEAVREAMDGVQFALRDYRTVLGENPVGNNAEITKALTGNNLKQVKIPIPSGSSLNGEGEMCDRWGTPYFFHQLSGKQMEIHSAGPDRKMGTGDDLVVK